MVEKGGFQTNFSHGKGPSTGQIESVPIIIDGWEWTWTGSGMGPFSYLSSGFCPQKKAAHLSPIHNSWRDDGPSEGRLTFPWLQLSSCLTFSFFFPYIFSQLKRKYYIWWTNRLRVIKVSIYFLHFPQTRGLINSYGLQIFRKEY